MNLNLEKISRKKGYKIIAGVDEAGRGPLAGPVVAAAVVINPVRDEFSNGVKSKIKNRGQLSSSRKRGFKIPAGVYPRTQAGAGMINKKSAGMINKKVKIKDKTLKEILNKAKDSKQLSAKKREEIFKLIKKSPDIEFSYASVNEKTIDKINIEKATLLAMKKCLSRLKLFSEKNKKTILILIDGNRIIDKRLPFAQKAIIKGDNKIASIALASIVAKVARDKTMSTLAKKYPKYKFEIHKGYPTKLHLQLLKRYGPCRIHRKSYKPIKILND